MNSITKIYRVSLLFITFIFLSYIPVLAQSAFNRNDNYDFSGLHYLRAVGNNPDNFNLYIDSDSDFRRFKLRIKRERLHLFANRWLANKYRVDMNNDGTWEQGWTTSNDITVSYYYPDPPNGISAVYNIKIEIEYCETYPPQCTNRTKTIPITIFSTPRVYVDSDNNSFVQLRNEDATNKIPVLMVEGFDALNENFPELYYNLTWNLVNIDMYPNGYEVFILNFANGGRDLRLNANVLMKAIEKVHEICPNYKIAIAGLSMGGPIARYALAKKEAEGGNHNVGLFLSYDSPQIWAHLNPELQDWIKGQDPGTGAIGNLQANLQSVAAKQMMGYNTYDPSHTFREQFYNELNALNGDGYPHQCYNVAVSNGNLQATHGYASVGRDLMTLKINDVLYRTVAAVQLDCGTGSKVTNITGRRYGDIFAIPFITIYYELEFYFNPVYHPTWSSLDLVNYIINGATGDITSFERSKFDDFVVQSEALEHHELSTVTRDAINVWLNKTSNITVTYSLPEGGSVTPENFQVQILHGIPITVQPKIVNVNGKQVTYTFWKWSDGNTENPRTFYTSHDASVTAVMKGANVSENQNTYANNSQRKFLRTPDGYMHKVYESMNSIWYEISTDGGTIWKIMNGGKPVASGAKLPSMDNYSNTIGIVYQEYNNGYYKIKLKTFYNSYPDYVFGNESTVFAEQVESYNENTNPVIAWGYGARAYVIWSGLADDGAFGYRDGLVIKTGIVNYSSATWQAQTVIWGTDNNSIYPTASIYKNYEAATKLQLAWEQFNNLYSRRIFYCTAWLDGSYNIITSSIQDISNGCGRIWNYRPSLIALANNAARINWIADTDGYDNTSSLFRDPGGARLYSFGYKVRSSQVTLVDDYSAYFITWSENFGGPSSTNKFTDSYTLSTIKTLNTTGKDLQLCNGITRNNMFVSSYVTNSLPYNFTLSNSIGSYYNIEKDNFFADLSIGRGGILTKDSAQFYFITQDIAIENQSVRFKELDEVLNFNSVEELNNCLESETFTINDNSEFTITYTAGYVDSLASLSSLSGDNFISFLLQLIDANTGEHLGNLKQVTFSSGNIDNVSESFLVNTAGMGNRTVKARVLISTSGEWDYFLIDNYSDGNAIGKESYTQLNLKNEEVINNYALAQNYPNPFNPLTTINYQIPKMD